MRLYFFPILITNKSKKLNDLLILVHSVCLRKWIKSKFPASGKHRYGRGHLQLQGGLPYFPLLLSNSEDPEYPKGSSLHQLLLPKPLWSYLTKNMKVHCSCFTNASNSSLLKRQSPQMNCPPTQIDQLLNQNNSIGWASVLHYY